MIAYYGHSVLGLLGALADSAWRSLRGERWRPCRKCGANLSNQPGERRCSEGGYCEWQDERARRTRAGSAR